MHFHLLQDTAIKINWLCLGSLNFVRLVQWEMTHPYDSFGDFKIWPSIVTGKHHAHLRLAFSTDILCQHKRRHSPIKTNRHSQTPSNDLSFLVVLQNPVTDVLSHKWTKSDRMPELTLHSPINTNLQNYLLDTRIVQWTSKQSSYLTKRWITTLKRTTEKINITGTWLYSNLYLQFLDVCSKEQLTRATTETELRTYVPPDTKYAISRCYKKQLTCQSKT